MAGLSRLKLPQSLVKASAGTGTSSSRRSQDSIGRPEQILAVARDITERRRAEHERHLLLARERQARADAENKAVKLQQSIEDLGAFRIDRQSRSERATENRDDVQPVAVPALSGSA